MNAMNYSNRGNHAAGNVIDMGAYRQDEGMDIYRYVLTPVCEFSPVAAPRPRRARATFNYGQFASTCVNLGAIAITFVLTAQLLNVM